MRAPEVRARAGSWVINEREHIARLEDVTAYGLVRLTFVSFKRDTFPADHYVAPPADAEEVSAYRYIDQDGLPTLLVTYKTPASRAAASRSDPMQAPEWLAYLEEHGLNAEADQPKE